MRDIEQVVRVRLGASIPGAYGIVDGSRRPRDTRVQLAFVHLDAGNCDEQFRALP